MAEHSESVGSVGEEAFKLLAALKGWGEPGDPKEAHGFANGHADHGQRSGGRDAHESNCQWCPLCRAVDGLRKSQPDVGEHLAAAASELLEAGAAWLQGMSRDPTAARRAQSGEGASSRGDDEDLEDA